MIQNASDDDQSMRLGNAEFRFVNSRFRKFLQKHEFKIFEKLLKSQNISLSENRILDAGCGSGYSTFLISNLYHPILLKAFDYMPEHVERALKNYPELDFKVGDMRSIESDDNSFDAVFVIDVIHHIPQWVNALKELSRVLVSGGYLLIEEPKFRFTFEELESGLNEAGFTILKKKKFFFGGFQSYLVKNQ